MSDALRVTLDQWRALVAVVEGGSYAKAAEALHRSQSSVTYAVQQIEAALDVRAFVAEGRKSVLTPTGRLLYRRARALLEEATGVEKAARSLSAGWEAEIRLAVEVLFPTGLLLQCLDRFGAESPHTRIEVFESVMAGTTEALVRREVDLGIAGKIPPGMDGEPLGLLRVVLVANPAHPLHRLGRPITTRDLRAHRHLVVRETDARRETASSIEVTSRWTVSNMSTSILAVAMGFGFAWFPEEKIRNEIAAGLLQPLPMRDGGARLVQLYLIFADRENAGPGVQRLAAILREDVPKACPSTTGPVAGPPAPRARTKRGRA